jgi:drug/metabolite transporter (DMT)-like permease
VPATELTNATRSHLQSPTADTDHDRVDASVTSQSPRPATWHILFAFVVVYVVWGSTYLAIRFAVETVPPFLICSARFLGSGLGLLLMARFTTKEKTTRIQWLNAVWIGGLLFLGGNGLVFWAETKVPSGIAALIVATVPLWIVGLDTLIFGARKPKAIAWVGFVMGLIGVAILVDPFGVAGVAIDPLRGGAVVAACFCWALGSLLGRTVPQPKSLLLTVAMQMLGGGVCLFLFSAIAGEWSQFDIATVSSKSLWSLAYLIGIGGMLTFSCYSWLMRVCESSVVSTYAYVNPVIAVFLGCWIGHEPFTSATAFGAVLIVMAVILIVSMGRNKTELAAE